VFTPFHKPPYTYPYGRSIDETTTTAARASVTKRVEDVCHLLREGLGDIEVVAADIEEGAVVAEAILEAG
jgi:hypothetical protein